MEVMKWINDHPHYIKALAEEALNCLKHEIPANQVSWETENIRKAEPA